MLQRDQRRLAGLLLVLGGSAIILGIMTAEAFYPGIYRTTTETISELGAVRDGVARQPSATIFDVAMAFAGVVTLAAAWLVARSVRRRFLAIALASTGLSALGIAAFPAGTGALHNIASALIFFSAGVAALEAGRVTRAPFRWLSIAMGAAGLIALSFYAFEWGLDQSTPLHALGIGGLERWIAYPEALWITAFGGVLMGSRETPGAGTTPDAPGDSLFVGPGRQAG
jgi:hypothetical membrane protein